MEGISIMYATYGSTGPVTWTEKLDTVANPVDRKLNEDITRENGFKKEWISIFYVVWESLIKKLNYKSQVITKQNFE